MDSLNLRLKKYISPWVLSTKRDMRCACPSITSKPALNNPKNWTTKTSTDTIWKGQSVLWKYSMIAVVRGRKGRIALRASLCWEHDTVGRDCLCDCLWDFRFLCPSFAICAGRWSLHEEALLVQSAAWIGLGIYWYDRAGTRLYTSSEMGWVRLE